MANITREQRRASTRDALIDAGRTLFARSGADGVSIRQVAAAGGCTHALVARYFGSKLGLEQAVTRQLAADLDAAVGRACALGRDPFAAFLAAAREEPARARLLIRCGLGDVDGPALVEAPSAVHRLIGRLQVERGQRMGRPAHRTRVCAYAASSLLLGWLTFEGFLVESAGLAPVPPVRRDQQMAAAAERVARMALSPEPRLRVSRPLPPAAPVVATTGPVRGRADSRAALIDAAVTLFAAKGPASVSIREIARTARVNQGLIYRHFGSKQALIGEAIERSSAALYPAALSAAGFDLDTVIRQVRRESPVAWLIARALVDDSDITHVRHHFPVVRRLLAAYGSVPHGASTTGLTDPRVAVATSAALALGSAIWDRPLRAAAGINQTVDLDRAVADIIRALLSTPPPLPARI